MNLYQAIAQTLLPLLLLAWLLFLPARGIAAYALQSVSIAFILLALALVALWAMPPFWLPYVFGFLFASIVFHHLSSGSVPGPGWWSTGPLNTVLVVLIAVPGLAGVWFSVIALQGRALPDAETVDIAPPFGPGHYLVAHGGSREIINVHLGTLDPEIERFRAWRGQSLALDIFRTSPFGWHVDGLYPADPQRYLTFGTPLLAPCSGSVALVENALPDMQVPLMDRDNLAGNFIAIDCGSFFVILAHLRQGSVRASPGDAVTRGQTIAAMGNSGNSSEPHLHVHAQRGLPEDAPLGGEPLGLTINGSFLVRNERIRIQPR